MRVGQEPDVIMPVPSDVAQLPSVGPSTHVIRRLEYGDTAAVLGQVQRQRKAQQASTHNANVVGPFFYECFEIPAAASARFPVPTFVSRL